MLGLHTKQSRKEQGNRIAGRRARQYAARKANGMPRVQPVHGLFCTCHTCARETTTGGW